MRPTARGRTGCEVPLQPVSIGTRARSPSTLWPGDRAWLDRVMKKSTLSRRKFALLGAGGLAASGGLGMLSAITTPVAGAPTAPRYPLRLLTPQSPAPLRAAPGSVDIGGTTTGALVYNGTLPGPVFQVRSGDTVAIPLTNDLSEETTVHWHGLIVPPAADGQPQDPVHLATSYTYSFTVQQRAGFSWYHPHPHMATAAQVAYGLAGGFLIRDAEEDALGLPAGAFEVPLVLRDANLDRAGNLSYSGTASGFLGKVLLV